MKKLLSLSLAALLGFCVVGVLRAEVLLDLIKKDNTSSGVKIDDATGNPRAEGLELNASDIATGTLPNARLDNSSVTLKGNAFNAANKLVELDGSGDYPALDGSAITNITAATADALSADPDNCGSGLLASGIQADGTADCAAVATAAASGSTEPVSAGALFTHDASASAHHAKTIDASELSAGILPDARLNSSSVTLQGNTFNGVSQLVQLDGSGDYPAADGSAITNVTAGDVAAANVTAGSFTGAFTHDTKLTISGVVDYGGITAVTLRTTACSEHVQDSKTCKVVNLTDYDLYTSTASQAGSWRNVRTGVAP